MLALLSGIWHLTGHLVDFLPREALGTAVYIAVFTGGLLGAAYALVATAMSRRRWPLTESAQRQGRLRRLLGRGLLLAFAVSLVVLALGVVRITLLTEDLRLPSVEPSQMWTPYTPGILLLAAALVLFALGRWLARRVGPRPPTSADIAEAARSHLRRIRYLQTLTTGFSTELSTGAPMRLGRSRSRQLAEHPPTLPQIVSQYREFATHAAQWWRDSNRGHGRIVIGIDEVDKIGGGELAQTFLNEIKSIFGTPHCLYLVTVSEEALTRFEQRSAAVRDAFDSAFDEVVRVERMGLTQAQEMLTRRVVGLTDPLIALCYVLSGGLPRDCLRVARSLVEIRGQGPADTGEFTQILVGREIIEAKNAVLGRLSRDHATDSPSDTTHHADAVDLLLDAAWPPLTPEGLAQVDGEPFTAAEFVGFRGRLMFSRAVLEVFTTRKDRLVTLLREDPDKAEHVLSRLATARITAFGSLPTGPGFLRDVGLD